MKTGTVVLIGAGVVAGGFGLAWMVRSKKPEGKSKAGQGKSGKAKQAKDKDKKAPTPKRTTPKSMQKPTAKATGDVFMLAAADAKAMACDLRGAKNVQEVEAVLDVLLGKIKASGASMVDLRSSGLTNAKIPVAQFEAEAAELLRRMRLLPQFLWGQARSKISEALSSLPPCDAPMQQWQAMFGEVSGVQAAVRPPPFTVLQGIRPLQG